MRFQLVVTTSNFLDLVKKAMEKVDTADPDAAAKTKAIEDANAKIKTLADGKTVRALVVDNADDLKLSQAIMKDDSTGPFAALKK